MRPHWNLIDFFGRLGNNYGSIGANVRMKKAHCWLVALCAHGPVIASSTPRSFSRVAGLMILALILALSRSDLGAAGRALAGREIFRQQCAKCHGRNGEGVKGLLRHFQWISSMEYVTCRLQNRASPEDFSLSDCHGPYAWLPRTNYSTLPGMLLSIRPSNDLGCLPCVALPFALPAPSALTVRALSWPLCPSPTDTTISNLCAPASRYGPYKYPGAL